LIENGNSGRKGKRRDDMYEKTKDEEIKKPQRIEGANKK